MDEMDEMGWYDEAVMVLWVMYAKMYAMMMGMSMNWGLRLPSWGSLAYTPSSQWTSTWQQTLGKNNWTGSLSLLLCFFFQIYLNSLEGLYMSWIPDSVSSRHIRMQVAPGLTARVAHGPPQWLVRTVPRWKLVAHHSEWWVFNDQIP